MFSDPQFWVSFIASALSVVLTGVCVYYQRQSVVLAIQGLSPKKRVEYAEKTRWWWWPVILMLCLSASAWIPYWRSPPRQIPFETMVEWGPGGSPGTPWPGTSSPPDLMLKVDGNLVSSYKDKYRLAGVAFHLSGSHDAGDIPALQKSGLYDIHYGLIDMRIPLDDQFMGEFRRGVGMTSYVGLLVPHTVRMEDFKTLHEAFRLGVIQIGTRGGPP